AYPSAKGRRTRSTAARICSLGSGWGRHLHRVPSGLPSWGIFRKRLTCEPSCRWCHQPTPPLQKPNRRNHTFDRARFMIEPLYVTKMYGDLYALNRLTIKLEKGDVYGFIGPNGAGKTTTMRILATLLNPTWGEATVCGYSIYNGAKDIRRLMGYMPD